MKRLYRIKHFTPYGSGVVGADIRLSLLERVRILFHGGLQITFVSESMRKEAGE